MKTLKFNLIALVLILVMSCNQEQLLTNTNVNSLSDSSWDAYSSKDVDLLDRKAILTFDGDKCEFDYGGNDFDRGTYEIVDGVFIFSSIYVAKWNIHWINNNEIHLTKVKEVPGYYRSFICIRK
jgi:hypothetical protein